MSASFDVFTMAVDKYAHYDPLPHAPEVAAAVAAALAELGGSERPWPTAENLDHEVVTRRLNQWSRPATPRNSVLVWLGHGESDGTSAWLALHGTEVPMQGSGVSPGMLAEHLIIEWTRRAPSPDAWTVVVVEACGVGTFVRRLAGALYGADETPRHLVLIGFGPDHGQANLGEFARTLRQVVDTYTEYDTRILLDDLVGRLKQLHRDAVTVGVLVDSAEAITRSGLLPVPATTVDAHAELRGLLKNLPDDHRAHFVPRAQGGEQGELAWYFTGRAAERAQVAGWLRDHRSGLLVVTGRAGAGKSALLGDILARTNPDLREMLISIGMMAEVPVDDRLPDFVFDAVVHLTGMKIPELVRRLSTSLARQHSDVDRLIEAVGEREFTIMADALDEAAEPVAIAESVLGRLAALPRCRVVVGTRASLVEGPDLPDTGNQDLLDALGRTAAVEVVRLERDPDAVFAYVRDRLTAKTRAGEPAVRAAADMVRERNREFLFARLAVHEILARPELLGEERHAELTALLDGDHRTLFVAAVRRLGSLAATHGPLLAALARSRGRGVPRANRVWATMAEALAPEGTLVGEPEVSRLLDDAAPYVMIDAEHGQAVYRLAHRTFQEHFPARAWRT